MIKRVWIVGKILPWFKRANTKAVHLDGGILFYKNTHRVHFVPYSRIKDIIYKVGS